MPQVVAVYKYCGIYTQGKLNNIQRKLKNICIW